MKESRKKLFSLPWSRQSVPRVSAMPWDIRLSEVCPKGEGQDERECVVGTTMEKKKPSVTGCIESLGRHCLSRRLRWEVIGIADICMP